jgi:DNA polymerase III subunit delta
MTVTLTGVNSFGLQRELKQITEPFLKQHGELGLERLDGEEVDFTRINEALTSPPFLVPKKLVVMRAPSKNKQFTENFEQLLGNLSEATDVILVEPKLDKRFSYYKYLKTKTDFREFPELDQDGLVRWLVEVSKRKGAKLNSSDARYLIERVGASQQLLVNELDKLFLFSPEINRQTIDLLTEPAPSGTIFQLLEATFAGKTKQALKLYEEQRAQKVEPQQVIAMLAWQLHVLAIVKSAGDRSVELIAKDARLNPFVVRKSQSIAKQLSPPELKKLLGDLLEIDIKAKSTGIDLDEALQHYLLKLAETN